MQPDQQQRIMGYFIEEAKDHLNTIEQGLLNLQSTIEDSEMMNEVFRAAHSVKGGAAMLGLSSIQSVAHRLEDFFKLLKENPIRVDQKLETLFLRAFDALQELLGQLQGPFGLTEEAAKNILAGVEPNFDELEGHLNHLIGQASPVPALNLSGARLDREMGYIPGTQLSDVLLQLFRTDVTAGLRDMLQLFKQSESDASVRQRLQDLCHGLGNLGEHPSLVAWATLLETVRRAIANPDNSYRILAPLVIKDIKLAQELVLAGRAHEIAPCPQMQQLVPVLQAETFIQEDLAAFLADVDMANLELGDSDIDLASMELDAIDLELSQPMAAVTSPFDQSGVADESGLFDIGNEFGDESLAPEELATHHGPEVGMAELNSLADLFEGEVPDLGLTWQEEVAIEQRDELLTPEIEGLTELDSIGDFSDLLFEETSVERPQSAFSDEEDFRDLFDDNLLEKENFSATSSNSSRSPESELADSDLDGFDDLLEIGASSSTASDPSIALDPSTTVDEVEGFVDQVGGFSDQAVDFDNAFGDLDLDNLEAVDLLDLDASADAGIQLQSMDEARNGLDDLDNLFGDLSEPASQPLGGPDSTPTTSSTPDPWIDELHQEPSASSGFGDLSLEQFDLETSSAEDFADLNDLDFDSLIDTSSALEPDGMAIFDDQDQNTDDFDSLFSTTSVQAEDPLSMPEIELDLPEADLFAEEEFSLGDLAAPEAMQQPSPLSFDAPDDVGLDDLGLDDLGLDGLGLDDLGLDEAESLGLTLEAPAPPTAFEAELLEDSSLQDLDDFLGEPPTSPSDSTIIENLDDLLGDTIPELGDTTVAEDLDDLLGDTAPSINEDLLELESLDLDFTDSPLPDGSTDLTVERSVDVGAELNEVLFDSSVFDSPVEESPDELADLLEVESLDFDDQFLSSPVNSHGVAAAEEEWLQMGDLTTDAAIASNGFDDLDGLLGDNAIVSEAEIGLDEFDQLENLLDDTAISTEDFADESFAADQFTVLDHPSDTEFVLADEFSSLEEFPEVESVSVVDQDFGDLENLLNDDASEQLSNDSLFGDLDNLLEDDFTAGDINDIGPEAIAFTGTAPVTDPMLGQQAMLGDFSDLEALLDGDAVDFSSRLSPEIGITEAAVTINDAEFDDLDNLLKETEEKMGGAPSVSVGRGLPAQTRRSVRPSRGFSEQTMRVPVKHLDNLSNLVGELVVNRNSLEQDQERLRQSLDNLLYQVQQLSDVGQRMQDLYERSLLESSLLASRQGYRMSTLQPMSQEPVVTEITNASATGIEYDPLEMDRFTGFHSLSQEMIELIVRVRESSSDIEFIVDETEQVTRMFRQVTTQLQEGLTRSRMVPFAQTADRLPRAIRDISMKVGKQVELVLEGRETLIDKMILEQLYDPMTHLVNNALTHGIESPDVRRSLGKSPSGRITIRAFHQGNQTIISVSDDGAGIDVDRVKTKAIEKGLLTAAEAKNLSRLDVYDILFHPGFSTKDQADDFSGRGVGMDVVRTSLSEIRGVINTDSNPRKGTTFTIRLPLTLSISKALCCISDRARIAFPMDGVEDMLDIPKDRIQLDPNGKTSIVWRDTVLLVHPLSELLGYSRHLSRGNVYGGNQEDDIVSVVVLRSAGNFLALQVDQVLGEQEIVIKQLEGPVPKPVGVAGATVLGDGRIMPIADVLELIDLSMGRIRRDASGSLWEQTGGHAIQEAPIAKTEPMVLIVDDSITVRELLSMTFNKVGYRVEQARDGQEAWEKLRSGLPCDIVFCDIEMPRMDGLELLSRIQKDANLKHLPIAMLTSRGADRHRQMAASLGASGYFTKPYLEEALLDAAQRMLKGERLLNAV